MATTPLTTRQRVQQQRRKVESREVVVEVNQVRKTEARKYNVVLNKLINQMVRDVRNELIGPLKSLQPSYVADGYASTLNQIMSALTRRWRDITPLANQIAGTFVNGVVNENRENFNKAIRKSIGVDLPRALAAEGLNDIIEAKTIENVNLIQSIPDQYFKSIVTIVNEGTTRGNRASSMITEILKLNKTTRNRAKVIARDQTTKVNSAVSQARQETLGVTKYRWRTSEDERVRDSHRRNNGKIFRWDRPPKETGHPGQDIQCRCVAEPIIEL